MFSLRITTNPVLLLILPRNHLTEAYLKNRTVPAEELIIGATAQN
jgi:hypothetical protein